GAVFSTPATLSVNVTAPTPPTINSLPDVTLTDCGTSWQLSTTGSFSDPSAGPWTGTVNYGDGGTAQALTVGANKTFSLAHSYAKRGVYQVTVCLTNGSNLTSTSSFLVGADFHSGLPKAYSSLVTVNDGSAQRSMVNSVS